MNYFLMFLELTGENADTELKAVGLTDKMQQKVIYIK